MEILYRLPRRTLTEIVGARNDHQPLARGIEREADIAKIRVRHMLKLRQSSRRQDSNHRPPRIELAVERFDFFHLSRRGEPYVESRKNPAIHRQQVRGEHEILRSKIEMLGNFRRVAMREEVIGPEILVHLDEMRVALRIFARASNAGLAVAHDAAGGV